MSDLPGESVRIWGLSEGQAIILWALAHEWDAHYEGPRFDSPAQSSAASVSGAREMPKDEDPEVFCERCLAGTRSSKHGWFCVRPGLSEWGESAPGPSLDRKDS